MEIYAAVITAYAAVVTIVCVVFYAFVFYRDYLPPIFDVGHRIYGVSSEEALQVILKILTSQTGSKPVRRFTVGPTDQVELGGGVVLNLMPPAALWDGYSATACSFPCRDPELSALEAVRALRDAGFDADIKSVSLPGTSRSIYLVKSNAFGRNGEAWTLVFRHHLMFLPKPPTKRITEA